MEAISESPIDEPVTFDNPPVGEVALAVQFAEPATDDAATLGRFWPRIQKDYPQLQTQPALPPMSEDFGPPSPGVSFQLLDQAPSQRYWFLSEDQTELVQVQPDRIAFNWRRDPTGDESGRGYPRYRHLRARFGGILQTFYDEMHQVGREPRATWCEVTYINPISVAGSARPDPSAILRRFAVPPTDLLPPPEDSALGERFLLLREGEPFGRFYVNATSAFRLVDQKPIYVLTLTVRGMASSPDVEGVLGFADYGRDLIVRAFRDMTTDQMHKEWQLR